MIADLTHAVEHGMVTYPGLPGPEIGTYLSREASAERYGPDTTFHIGRIELVANTGTYLDAPSHRFADGADLERPAHTVLLRAGIPVLEHLCNLDRLPGSDFRLHAAPVPIRGLGTFPVRAYAVLPD